MTSVLLGNGLTQTWNLDLDERVAQTSARTSGSVLLRNYTYDARDCIIGTGAGTFGYDDVGRLTSDTPSGGVSLAFTSARARFL